MIIHHRGLPTGPQHVTVEETHTERRAPTDESVRLLREMEEAARASVVASYVFRDNTFDGAVVFMEGPASTIECRVHFTLNGQVFNGVERLDALDFALDGKQHAVDRMEMALRAALTRALSEKLKLNLTRSSL